MTDYRYYKADKGEKALVMISCAGALLVVGILFYDTPFLVLAFPAAYLPASKAYAAVMAEKRRGRLKRQFRDFLDSAAASFAGGRHLKEALEEAGKELAPVYEEDDEIMQEIRWMLKRMEGGDTDEAVMKDFAERSGIDDIEMFSQVFCMTALLKLSFGTLSSSSNCST